MIVSELAALYSFNRWANHRLLDAAGELSHEELTRDLKSSNPSVLATLLHIFWSEWVWFRRWNGESPKQKDLPGADLRDAAATGARWHELEIEQQQFIGDLRDEDLVRRVRYENFAGQTWEYSLQHVMQHVVNHSSYHRGQVVTMLRQLGAAPPKSLDLITFYREQAQ